MIPLVINCFSISEAVKQYFRTKKRGYQDSLKSPNTQKAIKSQRNSGNKRNRIKSSRLYLVSLTQAVKPPKKVQRTIFASLNLNEPKKCFKTSTQTQACGTFIEYTFLFL